MHIPDGYLSPQTYLPLYAVTVPFLAVAAFQALRTDPGAPLPDGLRKLAVAVECFHKASLIHDDIEDGDATRYGEQTLHEKYGIAVALNVGDLLIGEGYRMLAACDIPAAQKAEMLLVASSSTRIPGFARIARAMASIWRWPWLRFPARSESIVW